MRRVVFAAALAAAFPGTAAADVTPDGPATLTHVNMLPQIGALPFPHVVRTWRVEVGENSRAGIVRPRFRGPNGVVVGDPVELPAQPGTYTFPAPRLPWRGGRILVGLEQTTGGHSIVQPQTCRPELGRDGDPCQNLWIDVALPGQADARITGAQLAIQEVPERDVDEDLLADATEDRTDLRLSAVPTREADGRLRLDVTLTNGGPLTAHLPYLSAVVIPGAPWRGSCGPFSNFPNPFASNCFVDALAPGDSRTFVLRADAPDARTVRLSTVAEGPDLVPADNEVAIAVAAAPTFDLVVVEPQRLRDGIRVRVRSVRAGRARIRVAAKVRRGRTVTLSRTTRLLPYVGKTVTIHPRGAKLRALRRAEAATITASTLRGNGKVSVEIGLRP
jgi:hypothetical protein